MEFVRAYTIRFSHCDPAGIVFYPQYFVLLNDHIEDWFAQALNCDFRTLHEDRRLGVPTVHIDCDFTGPSRLSDTVDITLEITRLGNASVTLAREIRCGAEVRVRLRQVLTCLDMDTGRATAWPEDFVSAMQAFLADKPDTPNPGTPRNRP